MAAVYAAAFTMRFALPTRLFNIATAPAAEKQREAHMPAISFYLLSNSTGHKGKIWWRVMNPLLVNTSQHHFARIAVRHFLG